MTTTGAIGCDGREPQPARAWRTARLAFHAALGAVLAIYVALSLYKWVQDIACPCDLDYVEGPMLAQTLRLARGEGLYNDYTRYPFLFSNYPPLFYAVAAVGVKFFGVSFAFARALAVAAMLGTGVMMTLLLRRCGVALAPALGAPAFLLSASIVRLWAGLMRVDTLALFFSMAGLYCVVRGGRWLVAALAFMVAAFYTKQSVLMGFAAAVLYLWWTRQRRSALAFAASWAAAVGLLFVVFQSASHGWFYRHVVSANVHPWHLDQALHFIKVTYVNWWAIMGLALAGAAAVLASTARRPPGDCVAPGERLLVIYFALSAVSELSAGKSGAFVNFMIEPLAAGCLLAAVGYHRLLGAGDAPRGRLLWLMAAAALSLQVAAMRGQPAAWRAGREARLRAARAAEQVIARTRGDIIGEPPGILVTSRRPLLLDPVTASHLALTGQWDQQPLVRDIRRERFSLIFMSRAVRQAPLERGLHRYTWTAPMMQAILAHYRDAGSAENLCFMVPRGRPVGTLAAAR